MPAPPNTSPATAINIDTLPFTYTQQVDDAGTTYTVYFKRTVQPGETGYLVWGFGDLVTYQPSTDICDASDVLIDFGEGATVPGGPNAPIQCAAPSATTLYFRVNPNGGNPSPANLTFSALAAPQDPTAAGDFFINEDSGTYPAVIYGTTADDDVIGFKYPFAGGERSAVFSDGTGLYEDNGGPAGDPATVQLYDGQLSLLNGNVMAGTFVTAITCNNTLFYVAERNGGALTVKSVSKDGATVTTVASSLVSIPKAIAVSPDGTTLYFVKNGGSVASGSYAIGTWNLTTNLAGPDFVAAVAGKNTCQAELLCLLDGRVVVAYADTGSPFTASIRVYNTNGSLYASYNIPNGEGVDQRLATAEDDPTSFVIYANNTAGTRYVMKLTTATGAAVWNVLTTIFNRGSSVAVVAAYPNMVRSGHAESCPVTVLRQALPSTPSLRLTQLPILVAYDMAQLTPFVTSGGLVWKTPRPA